MPAIPLTQAAFERSEIPKVSLVNMYYEKAPTSLEDEVSLRSRPRLALFGTAGSGPIRGLYRKGNVLANVGNSGKIICLSGTTLYRVDQNTGAATVIHMGVTGDLRMSAEGNEDVVVFTCGDDLYSTDGNTAAAIAFPDSKLTYAVDTLNGYFLVVSELGRFYWSAVGGITFDPLDYATAESQADVLLTLKVLGDEVWLWGRYSIEPWQPTGDADLPFQRIGGRVFGIGITGRETCQKFTHQGIDKAAWVGTDKRVYWTNPNPERISDKWVEELLADIDDPTVLYATVDTFEGDDFYVLHIPPKSVSLAFHLQTGKWHERASYGRSLFRSNVSTLLPNNAALLGDDTTNQLWRMTRGQTTDGSDPARFRFSGLLEIPNGLARCNSVSVDAATGLNTDPEADPMLNMRWSDDLGESWSEWIPAPLGRQGERARAATWTRLGAMERPGRIFEWETTEPITVRKARYNESLR